MNVDLPHPDGPISAVTSPGHLERDALEHLVVAEPGAHPVGHEARGPAVAPKDVVGTGDADVRPGISVVGA